MGVLSNIAHQTGCGALSEEKHMVHQDVEMEGSSSTDDRGSPDHLNSLPRWLQHSGGRAANPCRRLISLLSLALPFPLRYSTTRSLPKVQSTSYMNGMRGLACMVVFINHILFKYYPWIIHPYDGKDNTHLLQLPVVRLVHTGHSMVCIFLVMSGFVLSYSPLRKIHARQSEELVSSLCSSILRRGVRLFGPVWALAAITAVVTWVYPFYEPGDWRNGDPSFVEHVRGLVRTTTPLMNPFNFDVYFPKGFEHCWTLGAEYRCSMIVFLACAATSRLSTVARKTCLFGTAAWCMHFGRWDVTCFLAGMILAELRFAPLAADVGLATSKVPRAVALGATSAAAYFALISLSWTGHGSIYVQPYKMLGDLAPAWFADGEMYWGTAGAIVLLVLLENSSWCQWILTRGAFLYLGEISFAFYLLHLMSYRALGDIVFFILTQRWGFGYNTAWVVNFVVSLIALLWASDLFWRAIDEPMVNISRKVVDWLGVTKPVSGQ